MGFVQNKNSNRALQVFKLHLPEPLANCPGGQPVHELAPGTTTILNKMVGFVDQTTAIGQHNH